MPIRPPAAEDAKRDLVQGILDELEAIDAGDKQKTSSV